MKVWKLIVGFLVALIAMIFNMYITNYFPNYSYLQIIGYIFIVGGVWLAAASAKEENDNNEQ